jgi:hypothetical protein
MTTTFLPLAHPRRRSRFAAAVLPLWLAAGVARGGALVDRGTALRIEVTPLIVESGATRSLEPISLDAAGDEAGTAETSLAWSPAGPPLSLSLEAAVLEGGGEREHAFRLEATVRIGDSPPVRSRRLLTVAEGSTGLFDVLDDGSRRLVLSVRVEEVTRPVVRARREVGTPVLLRLEIQRREGERSQTLESNRLVTFLHEGVEYSFAHGEGSARESLRLVFTPLHVAGDVAELEVEVSGTLPDAAGPHVISRTERILASRHATSKVDVVAGDPPAGYRFLITPDF